MAKRKERGSSCEHCGKVYGTKDKHKTGCPNIIKRGSTLESLRASRENAKAGRQRMLENTAKRREQYNQNPKLCLECNGPIEWSKELFRTKFCSKSCSCIYNNRKRYESGWRLSKEAKRKTSKTMRKMVKDRNSVYCGRVCTL